MLKHFLTLHLKPLTTHTIMEMQRPFSQAVIGGAVLCLFSAFPPAGPAVAQQSGSPAPAFFTNEISNLKKRITAHEQNEAEARQALEQARKALGLATDKNNTTAQDISRQAIAISEEALSDVRKQKARDLARIKAIEAFLKLKTTGTDIGIACIVKGEVFKRTRSGRVRFDGSSPLVAGDTLETGTNGFLEVALPDYSYVSVGANSSFEIASLDRNRKQSVYTVIRREYYIAKIRIQRKCYLYRSNECWDTRYNVTPKVAIGVRGTKFNIEQNPDSSTTLIVFEGTVEVSKTDVNEPLKVNAMEQVLISHDGSIKGPVPVQQDSVQCWWDIAP